MIRVLENPLRIKPGSVLNPDKIHPRKHFKLYALYHPVTKEIRYIGLASGTLHERWLDHVALRKASAKKTYRYRWVQTLRKDGIKPGIHLLAICYDMETIKQMEIDVIKKYRELGYRLVNTSEGGEGLLGYNPSPETRIKIGSAMRGKKHTQEAKEKMSKASKGRKLSAEHKRKIGESRLGEKSHWYGMKGKDHPNFGKVWTEESKRKVGLANKGRIKTDEECKHHAEAMMGEKNPFFGKKHSEETKRKISEANKLRPKRTGWKQPLSAIEKQKATWEKKIASGEMCGSNNPFYGKTHSPEMRKFISERVKEGQRKKKEREQCLQAQTQLF